MDQMMTSFLLAVEDLLTHVPSTKSLCQLCLSVMPVKWGQHIYYRFQLQWYILIFWLFSSKSLTSDLMRQPTPCTCVSKRVSWSILPFSLVAEGGEWWGRFEEKSTGSNSKESHFPLQVSVFFWEGPLTCMAWKDTNHKEVSVIGCVWSSH